MNLNEVETKLKEEANNSAASKAVFEMLSRRKRNRSTLNVNSLYNRMLKEGYKFPRADYRKTIEFLGQTGVGKLKYTARGRLVGLTNLDSLKLIGSKAVGKEVVKVMPSPLAIKPATRQPKALQTVTENRIVLLFKGKPLTLIIPSDFTPQDIGDLVTRLYG